MSLSGGGRIRIRDQGIVVTTAYCESLAQFLRPLGVAWARFSFSKDRARSEGSFRLLAHDETISFQVLLPHRRTVSGHAHPVHGPRSSHLIAFQQRPDVLSSHFSGRRPV